MSDTPPGLPANALPPEVLAEIFNREATARARREEAERREAQERPRKLLLAATERLYLQDSTLRHALGREPSCDEVFENLLTLAAGIRDAVADGAFADYWDA